jgi:hypothetical protein
MLKQMQLDFNIPLSEGKNNAHRPPLSTKYSSKPIVDLKIRTCILSRKMSPGKDSSIDERSESTD